MSNVATVGPRWRPVDRALLWDESGLAKSIAQIVAKSVPGACLDLAEQEAFRKAKEPNRSYPYDVNFEQK